MDQLANIDIETIDKNTLPDFKNFVFDNSLSQKERMEKVIEATGGNPYCFRCGDTLVKLEFTEGGPTLQELFTDFLVRKKSGLQIHFGTKCPETERYQRPALLLCWPLAFPCRQMGSICDETANLKRREMKEVIMPISGAEQYSYQIGNITFVVTPVYQEPGETIVAILLKLMKADIERV